MQAVLFILMYGAVFILIVRFGRHAPTTVPSRACAAVDSRRVQQGCLSCQSTDRQVLGLRRMCSSHARHLCVAAVTAIRFCSYCFMLRDHAVRGGFFCFGPSASLSLERRSSPVTSMMNPS